MKDSPQEDVLTNSSDIDTHAYGASPAEVPTPTVTDTTPESGEIQQPQSDVSLSSRYPKRTRKPPDRLTY